MSNALLIFVGLCFSVKKGIVPPPRLVHSLSKFDHSHNVSEDPRLATGCFARLSIQKQCDESVFIGLC